MLPEESVGILIGSSFPGRIGIGKVEIHICLKRDNLVVGELSSIITREGFLECSWYILKHISESITDVPSCLLPRMTRKEVSTCTLCCRDDTMTSGLCRYDGIYFPMPDFLYSFSIFISFSDIWMIYSSLFDHDPVLYLVFLLSCLHLLLVLFSLATKMSDEMRMMISDEGVDRILRQTFCSFFSPSSCYLIWSISEWIILCSSETEENVFLQVTSEWDTTVNGLIECYSLLFHLIPYLTGISVTRMISTEARDG
jgi:hypothetical protein